MFVLWLLKEQHDLCLILCGFLIAFITFYHLFTLSNMLNSEFWLQLDLVSWSHYQTGSLEVDPQWKRSCFPL